MEREPGGAGGAAAGAVGGAGAGGVPAERVGARLLAVCLCVALAACGKSSGPSPAPCPQEGDRGYLTAPYATVDRYCQVSLEAGEIRPRDGVTPYDLNTPLFSDTAVKRRTVWIPAGAQATYDPARVFAFPTGTLITKSFGFRDDLRKAPPSIHWVETRVLLRAEGEWRGYTYLWDEAQKSTALLTGGTVRSVSWLDEAGIQVTTNYLVPSSIQCRQCHADGAEVVLIGPTARNLNRTYAYAGGEENQLAHWSAAGLLVGAPDPGQAPRLPVWNDPSTGSLEERARAYLEVNCAHCHSEGGDARTTGLYLGTSETNPARFGVCKQPVAAGQGSGGFAHDIEPGDPDHSIIPFRMSATAPSISMPQIARSVVDKPGVELVRRWILGLTGSCH